MFERIKIGKKSVAAVVVIVAVLVGAFFYGDGSDGEVSYEKSSSAETVSSVLYSETEATESISPASKISENSSSAVTSATSESVTQADSLDSSTADSTASSQTAENTQTVTVQTEASPVEEDYGGYEEAENQTEQQPEAEISHEQTSSAPTTTTAQSVQTTVTTTTSKPATTEQKKAESCVISISCSSVLSNMDKLDSAKKRIVPSDGIILKSVSMEITDGESVFDLLERACRDNGIHMESSRTPLNNSAYVEGIGNLYEFDCGSLSGWMYSVNGVFPNYSCSEYILKSGDRVEFVYTCDLGADVGAN